MSGDNGKLPWLHRGSWEKVHVDVNGSHGHSPTINPIAKLDTGEILVKPGRDGKFSTNLPAPYGPISGKD